MLKRRHFSTLLSLGADQFSDTRVVPAWGSTSSTRIGQMMLTGGISGELVFAIPSLS